MNIVWQKTDETEELRALLQAPVQPAQAQGWQWVPVNWNELLERVRLTDDESKHHGRGATYWNNAVFACRMAIRDALAAAPKPPVQEPVAWQFFDEGKWINGYDNVKDHRANTVAAGYPVRDLYAAAPQPVALVCDECGGNGAGGDHEEDCSKAPQPVAQQKVVMPECSYYDSDWSFGWNACLDEFERLNGGKP